MIVFENEFSAIIHQTQTIYDCNRLPSLCSNLLRPFDPLKDFSGRGQYHATTKGDLGHEETRSKIGHHRVQKKRSSSGLLFFVLGAEIIIFRQRGGVNKIKTAPRHSEVLSLKPNLKTYLKKRFSSHFTDKSTTNIPNFKIISHKLSFFLFNR